MMKKYIRERSTAELQDLRMFMDLHPLTFATNAPGAARLVEQELYNRADRWAEFLGNLEQ